MDLNFIYKATKIEAIIMDIDPVIATKLLKGNINNRSYTGRYVKGYVKDMREGNWKENGEGIIIDNKGVVKDGQHRLSAIIEANVTLKMPVIYGVNPDVMDTIDTGKNRSLKDTLEIAGITINVATISILCSSIFMYGNVNLADIDRSVKRYMTNQQGLQFVNDNKEGLQNLASITNVLYKSMPIRKGIYTTKEVGLILYVLAGGFNIKDSHIQCFKQMSGIHPLIGSSGNWIYTKLQRAINSSMLSYNLSWKIRAAVKSWNKFITGQDVDVSSMSIDNSKKIDDVLSILDSTINTDIMKSANKASLEFASKINVNNLNEVVHA